MKGFRPIGFLQGRVVLNVPDETAKATRDVDFRMLGSLSALKHSPDSAIVEWAVRFLDGVGGTVLAATGTVVSTPYTWRGNSIETKGRHATVDQLPAWYQAGQGNKHRPDNWKNNQWFGHNGAIIIAPPDYTPQMVIVFVLHQVRDDGRTRTYYRVNSLIMEDPEKYGRAPNLERLHHWGSDRSTSGDLSDDPFKRLPANTPLHKLGEWDAGHFGEIDSSPIPGYYLDRMLHPEKMVQNAEHVNPVTKVEKYELPLHVALACTIT